MSYRRVLSYRRTILLLWGFAQILALGGGHTLNYAVAHPEIESASQARQISLLVWFCGQGLSAWALAKFCQRIGLRRRWCLAYLVPVTVLVLACGAVDEALRSMLSVVLLGASVFGIPVLILAVPPRASSLYVPAPFEEAGLVDRRLTTARPDRANRLSANDLLGVEPALDKIVPEFAPASDDQARENWTHCRGFVGSAG